MTRTLDPWRVFGALLSLLLFAETALGSSDLWELRDNFVSSREVQVFAVGDLTKDASRAAQARFDGYDLTVFGPDVLIGSEADEHQPRIVLATPGATGGPNGEMLLALLGDVGVEIIDDGFRFYDRDWTLPEDGFAATFEDPDRPGFPLTLWYANSEPALALYLKGMQPAWIPGFASFRIGETELSGRLEIDGTLATVDLTDRRIQWDERTKHDRHIPLDDFDILIPKNSDVERAFAYLDLCRSAQSRIAKWANAPGEQRQLVSMTVHNHVEDLLALVGPADLSTVNPVIGRVHVLLAPGLPDDGGSAVAAATARQLLGPPAEQWMEQGAGVYGAGSWWGRNLEDWTGHIANSASVPTLAEICAEHGSGSFLSPHITGPLRGFWFGHLVQVRGGDFVRALWTGEMVLEPSQAEELEAEFRAALEALAAQRLPSLVRIAKARAELVASHTWRAGAVVVPGPKGAGYGSRACGLSLKQLAETGANSFALRVYAYQKADGPRQPGGFYSPGILSSVSDLELASAAAAGKRLGLTHMLQPFLLANPWGNVTASQSLTSAESVDGFFAAQLPYTEHYALLAELLGSDVYAIGTGLANTTKPPGDHEAPAAVALGLAKEAGWRELISAAGLLFHGEVTYVASTNNESSRLPFGDALDVFGTELFESLDKLGENHLAPVQKEINGRLKAKLLRRIAYAESAGKRLLIAGIGFSSTDEAWREPRQIRGETSCESQEMLYRALTVAMRDQVRSGESSIAGIYLWKWSSFPSAGGLADRGYTPQNKPAMKYLPELFKKP